VTRCCCKREDAKSEKEQSSSDEMLFCSEKLLPSKVFKKRNFSPQPVGRKRKEKKNWHQGNLLTFPRSELLTPVFQDQQLLILLASHFFIHMAIPRPVCT
jgi:hypothetical protein